MRRGKLTQEAGTGTYRAWLICLGGASAGPVTDPALRVRRRDADPRTRRLRVGFDSRSLRRRSSGPYPWAPPRPEL